MRTADRHYGTIRGGQIQLDEHPRRIQVSRKSCLTEKANLVRCKLLCLARIGPESGVSACVCVCVAFEGEGLAHFLASRPEGVDIQRSGRGRDQS